MDIFENPELIGVFWDFVMTYSVLVEVFHHGSNSGSSLR